MERDRIEPYFEFVRPHYADKDPAHDFRHIERIVSRLEVLGAGMSPTPAPHLLHFLAAFHGLGLRLRNDEDFRREVREFLAGLGWEEAEIASAFVSLGRHLEDPRTVEEKIVRDANYVELLGAFGVAKAFTAGGARGQTLEETARIYATRYLDKITFRTPVARQLAEEGKRYAREFLERLEKEW